MEISDFIKNDFDKFSSQIFLNTVEEYQYLKEMSKKNRLFEQIYQCIFGRRTYIKEILKALGTHESRLLVIKGEQGSGKTILIKTLIYLLEKNSLNYYYECTQATHLDDIILSLFNFLKKTASKDPEYIRNFKVSGSLSIDQRLINNLKKLNRPMIIFIDGVENLYEEGSENTRNEISLFLKYIISIPTIKVILAGEKITELADGNKVYGIELPGLNREDAFRVIGATLNTQSTSFIEEVYSITKGYPDNIHLFANFCKSLNAPPLELISEFKSSGFQFEKFMARRIFFSIPEDLKKLAYFFALLRHSLHEESLKNINFIDEIEAKIRYLNFLTVIKENSGCFHIKKYIKDFIISKIPFDERLNTHKYLYNLYSSQLSKKLEERILPISRKILYEEQYHHYINAVKLGGSQIIKTDKANKDSLSYFNYNKIILSDKNIKRKPESEKSIHDYHESQINRLFEDISDDELQIELSDEEKKLVYQQSDENDDNKITASELSNNIIIDNKHFKSLSNPNTSIKKHEKLLKSANYSKEHFKHDQALKEYFEIINSETESVPEDIRSQIYESIGEIYDYRRNFDSSVRYYIKAVEEAEKAGQHSNKFIIFFKLALAYDDSGNTDKALEYYNKNIQGSQDVDVNPFVASSCANIASIYEDKNQLELALEFYNKAFDYDKKSNNLDGQYETLSRIGNIYFEMGKNQEALRYFKNELYIARLIKDPYKVAMSYIDLGDFYLRERNYEKAVRAFVMAKKSIENTISTDSREKINRRFNQVITEIGKENYLKLLEKLREKNA